MTPVTRCFDGDDAHLLLTLFPSLPPFHPNSPPRRLGLSQPPGRDQLRRRPLVRDPFRRKLLHPASTSQGLPLHALLLRSFLRSARPPPETFLQSRVPRRTRAVLVGLLQGLAFRAHAAQKRNGRDGEEAPRFLAGEAPLSAAEAVSSCQGHESGRGVGSSGGSRSRRRGRGREAIRGALSSKRSW